MSEDVVFKGSRAGLHLVFKDSVEFAEILNQIRSKLESAMHFFGKGTTVNVAADKITREQQSALTVLLRSYGLTLRAVDFSAEALEEAPRDAMPPVEKETLIVRKTVRGGQEIFCEGSVVVLGNVNPGAKIVAGGNIVVRGACRGSVHAGAFGNARATIIADRMLAMQIRIADFIARAPDQMEKSNCTECAHIKDGNIVIEPVDRQEVS